MDLRIDRVRAALIQKIEDSDDLEKLQQLLWDFDHPAWSKLGLMTPKLYLERTQEGLRSAAGERRYSSDEVRAHFGIPEKSKKNSLS